MKSIVLTAVVAALFSAPGAASEPAPREVDLNARCLPGGSGFDVDDAGLAIRLAGSPAADGIVDFRGEAGGALTFEARPLASGRPPYGYSFIGTSVAARVTRYGEGLLLEGRAGARPLMLTLEPIGAGEYRIVGRDGTSLNAWITSSLARVRGAYDPDRMSYEGLSVLGAAMSLMCSDDAHAARGAAPKIRLEMQQEKSEELADMMHGLKRQLLRQ
ncbi:MAG: hypothetical protein KGJ84_05170 [Elusimicrobia bacterium]|nr:hypothetical protein [Elusimicrobiota bacterium]